MDEAELMDDGDHLVELAFYQSLDEFAVAKSLLDSADIECFSDNEYAARIAGPLAAAIGIDGFRLFVWASDLAAARGILLAEWPKPPKGETAGN